MTGDPETSAFTRAAAVVGGLSFGTSLIFFLFAYLALFEATTDPWTLRSGLRPILVNVALFAAFGLHHSVLARSGVKRALTRVLPERLERTSYVAVASVLFLVVCWSWQPVPGVLWNVGGLGFVLLTVVQLSSIALTLRAAAKIDVLDLAGVNQALQLVEEEAPALTTDGLYGFVRHPIYFAWLLLVWPTPEMSGTRLVFAALSTAYLVVAIPLEERDLARTFGAAYGDYRRRVRWRLVPFVY